MTDEATQSYHKLQNKSELFIHFQPVKVRRKVLSHCLLQSEETFYATKCAKINGFDEWNPAKFGWLKSGENGDFLRPSKSSLSRYFQVHRRSCGTLEATFHGMLNVTNLEQQGEFLIYFSK